jgi:hypothetical protein
VLNRVGIEVAAAWLETPLTFKASTVRVDRVLP